jgi:predicted  nucleic acid-binding Zn-ribbon protein
MTDNTINLLAVFEDRLHDLIKLCNERKETIDRLENLLNKTKKDLKQAKNEIEILQSKYNNLLTAKKLSENESEFQNARNRINKLVREVDTCIALL